MPEQAEQRAVEIFQSYSIYLQRDEASEDVKGDHGKYEVKFFTIIANDHSMITEEEKEDAIRMFGDRHSTDKDIFRSEYIRDSVLFALAISYTYQGRETFVDGKLFIPAEGI